MLAHYWQLRYGALRIEPGKGKMYAGKNNHSVENTPLFCPFSPTVWGACGGEKTDGCVS